MQNYKLIVSDLDGTLLNEEMETGERNDAAIRAFFERGILFVPSSGRTYYEIPESVRENPYVRYVIYSNGTVVYDKKEKKAVISNEISESVSKMIVNISKKYDIYVSAHLNGRANVPHILEKDDAEHYQINEYYRSLLNLGACYGDLDALEARCGTVEAFVLFFHDDGELALCEEELSRIPEILVTSSISHNLEIVSASAGKGRALTALADMLGIKKEEIISIGDSTNDVSMFEASGLSLCAAGGNEEARRSADMIICPCEAGVADHVLKNILK